MFWLKRRPVDDYDALFDYAESTACPSQRSTTTLCKPTKIKQEPVDDYDRNNFDIYGDSVASTPRFGHHDMEDGRGEPIGRHFAHYSPRPLRGAELTEKSRQVQQAKRYGLTRGVFETTGMIVGPVDCLRVTHMMIDNNAHSTIISLEAVQDAGLRVVSCTPKTVPLANGNLHTYYERVYFKLYMSGVHARVGAYVDHGNPEHHILLGKRAIQAFNAKGNFSFGPKKETRWSVAQDVTGKRKHRLLLQKDRANAAPTLTLYSREMGLELAEQLGETAKERNSREILDRHKERGVRLYKKHARNVRQNSYGNYSFTLFG